MSVMFGVILDQTGTVAFALIHPQTSSNNAQSWPTAAPILRSGIPWGHEKLISIASCNSIKIETTNALTIQFRVQSKFHISEGLNKLMD